MKKKDYIFGQNWIEQLFDSRPAGLAERIDNCHNPTRELIASLMIWGNTQQGWTVWHHRSEHLKTSISLICETPYNLSR